MLEELLMRAAEQARAEGRWVDTERSLTRATELFPESPRAWGPLIQLHENARDWRAAEQVARRGVSARPDDAGLHRSLAMALVRQERPEEAVQVLRRFLARRDDPAAEALLARLDRELESSRGMAQRGSLHFRVRFEGETDDALGKALLEVLEDKHALLTRTLGYEPRVEIPVILYPRQTFRAVSNSPDWAGATYSHFDGRIRIGTRDLTAGFVPLDLERLLTHELVHVFVDWRTGGRAPRDINEGLAQYLSGKRLGYRLAASRTVIRDGEMSVRDFYDSALSFVEYLVGRYGQASMNDLLKRMGELGDVDQAFRRAYGQGYAQLREEWIQQLD
jgi:tetratricopeptide (TPR) repeat protein